MRVRSGNSLTSQRTSSTNHREATDPRSDHALSGFERLSTRSSSRHLYRYEFATSAARSNSLGSGGSIRPPCARHSTMGRGARNRASDASPGVSMNLLSNVISRCPAPLPLNVCSFRPRRCHSRSPGQRFSKPRTLVVQFRPGHPPPAQRSPRPAPPDQTEVHRAGSPSSGSPTDRSRRDSPSDRGRIGGSTPS